MDVDLTSRLMAAYQFAAQELGDRVSVADVRLHLRDVQPNVLNPLLRELDGTVVEFWVSEHGEARTGLLSLLESAQEASWRELDDGVEIGSVIYTHMMVQRGG